MVQPLLEVQALDTFKHFLMQEEEIMNKSDNIIAVCHCRFWLGHYPWQIERLPQGRRKELDQEGNGLAARFYTSCPSGREQAVRESGFVASSTMHPKLSVTCLCTALQLTCKCWQTSSGFRDSLISSTCKRNQNADWCSSSHRVCEVEWRWGQQQWQRWKWTFDFLQSKSKRCRFGRGEWEPLPTRDPPQKGGASEWCNLWFFGVTNCICQHCCKCT